ncbi:hypothetical protein BMS3Bbin09_01624 [bacterium BMS3Bbin09]|nr:hypothetical protein BMS3Bbin09_01624 [bacterium BMS3Bbin09]
MKQKFEAIIKYIISGGNGDELFAKINIPCEFRTEEDENASVARNLNAAFLVLLSGESHSLYNDALHYMENFGSHPSWEKTVCFYNEGIRLISSEISNRCYDSRAFEKELNDLYLWVDRGGGEEAVEKLRRVFFPEGVLLNEDRENSIRELRKKRKIDITSLNPSAITNPAKEILFSSNILVTVPSASKGIEGLPVSLSLKKMLEEVVKEDQIYWYDHPVPVGVPPGNNEVLYGLEGLDRAVGFEKERGTISREDRVICVLSVSVTHKGLQGIVKEYIEDELKKEKNIRHLEVYVFTEADTVRMIEDVIIPAAGRYSGAKEYGPVYEVIGVDGEYGRHYSFLKAVSAFWQVLVDPQIRGTFKIDLDQVFPQKELVAESGASAFEHLMTPLWGAEGVDSDGNDVELGMIAGALVNQKDIDKGLFTPDVCFPEGGTEADEIIFFSKLPQALSTEAEMMTRYTGDEYDGKESCIHRIHVTGGTNGITINALRKHRPFTPTFIGRAEDQAYILSVLFEGGRKLRYVHKDGLIMRHDKEAFAAEAVRAAASGKLIGDYIRTLMFSYYAEALPWPIEEIKDAIDPFTGCFVSKIPLTVVYLRFSLKLAFLLNQGTKEKDSEGLEFGLSGIRRLYEIIQKTRTNSLVEQFNNEKKGWDLFYDALDNTESGIKKGDPFALELKEKAAAIIDNCRINF